MVIFDSYVSLPEGKLTKLSFQPRDGNSVQAEGSASRMALAAAMPASLAIDACRPEIFGPAAICRVMVRPSLVTELLSLLMI